MLTDLAMLASYENLYKCKVFDLQSVLKHSGDGNLLHDAPSMIYNVMYDAHTACVVLLVHAV